MTTSRDDRTIVGVLPPARELRVVNWPVRDDPCYALAVLALVALCAMAVTGITANKLAGVAVLAALLLTTWRLWMPVTCELSPLGLKLRCLRWQRRIPWRQIEQVTLVPRGVLLCCRRAGQRSPRLVRFYLPWRRHAQLVAEFHAFYRLTSDSHARPSDEHRR